ncbi:MAG TPA: phosphotransferase, partial [Candidatus Ozemobacteraceae bacterium]|nr:phosphotransferase [Candidatus Ozemobacteraceae bacterium]
TDCRSFRPCSPDQQAELARFGSHNLQNTPGADFIGGIEEPLACGQTLNTGTLSLPVFPFLDTLELFTGFSPRKMTDELKRDLVFILVGAHTDIRVYHTAFTLRHDYQFPHVVVCPHLVGSPNHLGHEQYLQANYSDALIRVVSDLRDVYTIAGFEAAAPIAGAHQGCRFQPADRFASLSPDYQEVLKRLFLFQAVVELKQLGGGYSGSLLVIATGTDHHGARLAPVIVKIDRHDKIQREIEGYHRVNHLIGNHVPHFHTPVSHGEATGIRMDVATMSGLPQTFQRRFETAADQAAADRFLRLLRGALTGLIDRVIANRRHERRIYPYRELGLHTRQQLLWLTDNLSQIIPTYSPSAKVLSLVDKTVIANPYPLYEELVGHADRLEVPVSLCHGDLNLANLITDDSDNWWIIDWSYAAEGPVERDLAKLENDLKFVLMREVVESDYPRLLCFETFLQSTFALPALEHLPQSLRWLSESTRWQLLYQSLREVREAAIRAGGPQRVSEMYDLFLVKFAAHTLSFDQRRVNPHTGQPRGECSVPMMTWAAISLSLLLGKLKASPWHTRVLRDRLAGYPERFPVPIEKRSWSVSFPEYRPPWHVIPAVLANDGTKVPSGWADPEDHLRIPDLRQRQSLSGTLNFDTEGRPLNPSGRTGIAGRGF